MSHDLRELIPSSVEEGGISGNRGLGDSLGYPTRRTRKRGLVILRVFGSAWKAQEEVSALG